MRPSPCSEPVFTNDFVLRLSQLTVSLYLYYDTHTSRPSLTKVESL